MAEELKTCSKCGVEKPVTEYYQWKKSPIQLESTCKKCRYQRAKKWQQEHREECNARAKRWQVAHAEEYKASRKRWYKRHRKECNTKSMRWHREHPQYYRAMDLKRTYGLTTAAYQTMLSSQGSRCAICDCQLAPYKKDIPEGAEKQIRVAHVDHNHETGAVRGLLCMHCNQAVGIVFESEVIALRLAAYIRERCSKAGTVVVAPALESLAQL